MKTVHIKKLLSFLVVVGLAAGQGIALPTGTALYTWGRLPSPTYAYDKSGMAGPRARGNEILPQSTVAGASQAKLRPFSQQQQSGVNAALESPSVNVSGLINGHTWSAAWSVESNQVFTWGYNDRGVLCNNYTAYALEFPTPIILPANESVKKVVAGTDFMAVLMQSGKVFTCGCGRTGVLGIGSRISRGMLHQTSPIGAGNVDDWVVDIVATDDAVLVKTGSGLLYTWGDNFYGLLGRNTTSNVDPFSEVPVAVPSFAADPDAVLHAGVQSFYVTGSNIRGVLQWGSKHPIFGVDLAHRNRDSPQGVFAPVAAIASVPTHLQSLERAVGLLNENNVVVVDAQPVEFGQICSSKAHGACLLADGVTLLTWGNVEQPIPTAATNSTSIFTHTALRDSLISSADRITQIECGAEMVIAVTESGQLYAWGSNAEIHLAGLMPVSRLGRNRQTPPAIASQGLLSASTAPMRLRLPAKTDTYKVVGAAAGTRHLDVLVAPRRSDLT